MPMGLSSKMSHCAPSYKDVTLTFNSWCMVGTEEYQISGPTATEEFQAQYTSCHTHGTET
jgi:hypothetical protein